MTKTCVFGARFSRKLVATLFVAAACLWMAGCSGASSAPNAVDETIDGGGSGTGGNSGIPLPEGGGLDLDGGGGGLDGSANNCDGGHCYAAVDAGPYCGDLTVQADLGEVCDDGDKLSGNGCSANCKLVEPYFNCPSTGGPCTSTIRCGNSIKEPGEECDDGNANSNDGCSSACKLEPGYRCPTVGQACEKLTTCGDGKLGPNEQCDLGSANGTGVGCTAECGLMDGWTCKGHTCKRIEICGDGTVTASEQCDEGTTTSSACCVNCKIAASYCSCPSGGGTCTDSSACGNGALEKTETCDDGNTNSGDGCSSSCEVESGYQCRMAGKPCVTLCGDSVKTGGETCDDGNANSGDGCSSTCQVEPGWDCPGVGASSNCTRAVCGNGVKEVGESCDLGAPPTVANGTNGLFYGDGTGCSKTCTNEPQCRSNGVTGPCSQICGDGNKDPNEECDDGNQISGDGCSSACRAESGFTCTDQVNPDTQPCPSNSSLQCLVLPVVFRDFDGQNVTGGHPDFFFLGASASSPVQHTTGVMPGTTKTTCVPNAIGTRTVAPADYSCPNSDQSGPCTGIAQATLGANGKPTLGTQSCYCEFTEWDSSDILGAAGSSNCAAAGSNGITDCWVTGEGSHRCRIEGSVKVVESATSFAQWYTDSSFSTKVLGTLELAATTGGLYQFSSSTPGAAAGATGRTYYDDIHAICLQAAAPRTGTLSSGFFPLENQPRGKTCNIWPYWLPALATSCCASSSCPVKSQWDPLASYDNCPTAGTGGPVPRSDGSQGTVNGVLRNFYFTTEARYLFHYNGTAGTLSFFGDDDVWVYINGRIAIDLGAPHERAQGQVAINATTFNLTAGNTYEIAVFHADRHPRESNYQLTLPGFTTTRSICTPRCGDSIVTAGEECDNGSANQDGLYGGCTTQCKFGPFCGDGTINGTEECDDGKNTTVSGSASGCGPGCKLPPRCGDGILQPGEECDEGNSNANAQCGGCSTSCALNPYCGDGTVDTACGEECDDGDNTGGYGFCGSSSQSLPNCLLGPYCGDGITQSDQGEQCDNGSSNGDLRCTTTCQIPGYCGDGVVQTATGETCDDGKNDSSYGGCTPDCQRGPHCGDSVLQAANGEECDLGPNNAAPGALVPYGGCTDQCKLGPRCGDGVVQSPDEKCDLGVNNGPTTECSTNCMPQAKVE